MKEQVLGRLLARVDQLDHATLASLARKFYSQRNIFEKVINVICDGVVMIDRDGQILLANNVAEELLNVRNLRNMVLWKCAPEILQQIDLGQIQKKSIIGEVHLSYPTERTLRFYSVPFITEMESQIICVFSDITQDLEQKKKELEEERTHSILLLSAGVAHEIGNPLNSISLQLELMQNFIREQNFDEISESVTVCRKEVERLHGIIKNFLQAVQPVTPNFSDAHLLELLNFVIKFLSPELDNAGVAVHLTVNGDVPVVLADNDQMKQVFFNIIKNAMEAMTHEKCLSVSVGSDNDFVILKFTDTGIGIPTERLGKVFEPFCTSKKQGTGLGMFIVQRILHDHHATIAIESKTNMGTTITIKFPRKVHSSRMLNATDGDKIHNH
ncbi:MAG: GHKL domain-containing protein [Puniceicoccales bacterium]|jgi:nitrogen fixation/metabolism regulation signal transduction histidine kinase|nr:GHKL domain-containing protein [Puniceicoccales bacterium]